MNLFTIKNKMADLLILGCLGAWFASVLFVTGCDQQETTWAKRYAYNTDFGTTALQAGDGGVFHLTATGRLIKVDETGAILWQKSYDRCKPVAMALTNDGDLIAAGPWSCDSPEKVNPVGMMRIDSEGNVRWAKSYNSSYTHLIHGIDCNQLDGSIIMAGGDYDPEASYSPLLRERVTRFDGDGNSLWEKTIDTESPMAITDLKISSDEGFIMADNAGVITKMSPSGAVEWRTKCETGAIGYVKEWMGCSIEETSDGYMVVGNTEEEEVAVVWLMKLDRSGGKVWAKTIHNVTGGSVWGEENPNDGMMVWANREYHDHALSIKKTADGGYALLGKTDKVARTNVTPFYCRVTYTGGWIIKIDEEGAISWQKKYADDFRYEHYTGDAPGGEIFYTTIGIRSFDVTAENGFILSGAIHEPSGSRPNALLLMCDERGDIAHTKLNIQNAQATIKPALFSTVSAQGVLQDLSEFTPIDETIVATQLDPGFIVDDL